MFYIVVAEDVVRIPPERFQGEITGVALDTLKKKYERTLTPELGYVILVIDVKIDPVGKIVAGDGATYHKATIRLLTFIPKVQEVIEGTVTEITKFGAFVNIGPAEALLHLSQILDEYLTVDEKQNMILAKNSGRKLVKGSVVRARITAVSLGRGTGMGKIALTCRQPYLGALEWIAESLAKARPKVEREARPAAPAKG
jgi:DNA-directed RNA polymerase subunit E'